MQLKQALYYPQTAPRLSKYRLVDMFTSVTDESVKTNTIRNFTSPSGHCWVVIGTIPFGMGLDSPNVRTVIHWGPHLILNHMCSRVAMLDEMFLQQLQFCTMTN